MIKSAVQPEKDIQTQTEPINAWSVFFSIVYFAIAVGIVYFRRDEIFYLEPRCASYQFDRFLWCLSASFFGFSVLAFRLRRVSEITVSFICHLLSSTTRCSGGSGFFSYPFLHSIEWFHLLLSIICRLFYVGRHSRRLLETD